MKKIVTAVLVTLSAVACRKPVSADTQSQEIGSGQSQDVELFGQRIPLVSKVFNISPATDDDISCTLEDVAQDQEMPKARHIPETEILDVYKYINAVVLRVFMAAKLLDTEHRLPANPPRVIVNSSPRSDVFVAPKTKRDGNTCMYNPLQAQWAIYFNAGYFQEFSERFGDAEFATVIGHELSHITRGANAFRFYSGTMKIGSASRSLTEVIGALSKNTLAEDAHILSVIEFRDFQAAKFLKPENVETGTLFDFLAASFIAKANNSGCPGAKLDAERLLLASKMFSDALSQDLPEIPDLRSSYEKFRSSAASCQPLKFWDEYGPMPRFFIRAKRNADLWNATVKKTNLKQQLENVEVSLRQLLERFDGTQMRSLEIEADQLGFILSYLAGFNAGQVFGSSASVPVEPVNVPLVQEQFGRYFTTDASGYTYTSVDPHPFNELRNQYLDRLNALIKKRDFLSEVQKMSGLKLLPHEGLVKSNGRYLFSKELTDRVVKKVLGLEDVQNEAVQYEEDGAVGSGVGRPNP